MKILIVDDQRSKYLQIKPILENIFNVEKIRHVKNFLAAISVLENLEWDLVILDMSFNVNDSPSDEVGFEGLAGLQVLQHMYRMNSEVSIIIFTAHKSFEDPFHESIEGLSAMKKHVKEYFDGLCLGCIYSKQPDEKISQELMTILKGKYA